MDDAQAIDEAIQRNMDAIVTCEEANLQREISLHASDVHGIMRKMTRMMFRGFTFRPSTVTVTRLHDETETQDGWCCDNGEVYACRITLAALVAQFDEGACDWEWRGG